MHGFSRCKLDFDYVKIWHSKKTSVVKGFHEVFNDTLINIVSKEFRYAVYFETPSRIKVEKVLREVKAMAKIYILIIVV